MDVDGQIIFTDCQIKPETDATKQPSPPADGSDPLLLLFLKSFLYPTENSGAPVPPNLLERPIVRSEKSSLLWVGERSCGGDLPGGSPGWSKLTGFTASRCSKRGRDKQPLHRPQGRHKSGFKTNFCPPLFFYYYKKPVVETSFPWCHGPGFTGAGKTQRGFVFS